MKDINYYKRTLLTTKQELADLIGINVGTLSNWSGLGKIPEWAQKALESQVELQALRKWRRTLKDALGGILEIEREKRGDKNAK